uniref:Uncharacterized protein n=1 Tax=Anguilla anguilla TaxID=7936 RepID=A0A0E9TUX5_ANGAN
MMFDKDPSTLLLFILFCSARSSLKTSKSKCRLITLCSGF